MKYFRLNKIKQKDISTWTLIIFKFLRVGVTYETSHGRHYGILLGLGRLELNFILRFWDAGLKIWAAKSSYDA